jgi:hypothetical protein
MPTLLLVVGGVLIEWLLLAAEVSGRWVYYIYSFGVLILWTEAIHKRRPNLYPNRGFRIVFFSVFYLLFLLFNKSVFFVRANGLVLPGPLPEGALPEAALQQWLASMLADLV